MKTKKKTLISLVCIVLIFCFTITISFAYDILGYKLVGGVYGRQYNIIGQSVTYNGTTVDYASSIRSAVSNWNSAVNGSVDVQFTEILSSTGSEMIVTVMARPYNNYPGFTYYQDSNGIYLNSLGNWPVEDYAKCTVEANPFYVHDKSQDLRTNVVAHEMGHVLGLKHSEYDNALMAATIYDQSRAVPSIGVRNPQSDDVDGVRDQNS